MPHQTGKKGELPRFDSEIHLASGRRIGNVAFLSPIMKQPCLLFATIVSFLGSISPIHAQLRFVDDFDRYTSPVVVTNTGFTNGYIIRFAADSGPKDFQVIFGFDYSTVTQPIAIPPAPHSTGGTTKGLYLTVNKDATGAAAAVNLYSSQNVSFNSPDSSLKFDVWMNWKDSATATEHVLFGIGHSGNVTNRIGQPTSDGLFFAMDGDGGIPGNMATLRDYSILRGGGNGAIPFLMLTNNTIFGPAPLLGRQFDNADAGFANLFPSKAIPGYPNTPAGSAGLGWVSGEVRQVGDTVTWLLNETIIAQFVNPPSDIYDNFLLGYNDAFASIGDTNNFVIFDNIRFEPNPNIVSVGSYAVPENGGTRIFFTVVVSGTPPFDFKWQFTDEDDTYPEILAKTSAFTNTVSRFFGPFDSLPRYFYINAERYDLGGERVGFDGAYGGPPSCGAICLSVGSPSTFSGTVGSGTNFSFSSSCGSFSPGSRWFRMSTLDKAGIASVSTEGSSYDTVLGIYRGSISDPRNLTLVACNNDIGSGSLQSRVQFETQPNTTYWLVVNPPNAAALKLNFGYDLKFASVARSNNSVVVRSAPVPSLRYILLASTNLSTNAASWIPVLTNNFSSNSSSSNNILQYVDTNAFANLRRYYRMTLAP